MNYPKQIKRKDITKRIVISWLLIAVVFFTSGFAIGKLTTPKHKDIEPIEQTVEPKEEAPKQFTVYGAYDDRTFTSEVSLDWGSDDNFEPLDCKLDEETQEFTYYLCKGYDIDFTLVMAVMFAESSFRSDLVSGTNDYGLMQINKCNHQWLTETIGVTDFTDPKQNVRAGCFIIRKLFEKYQNPEMVLMAYHFGENGAKNLWNEGIYESKYSQAVLKYQKDFIEQTGGDSK